MHIDLKLGSLNFSYGKKKEEKKLTLNSGVKIPKKDHTFYPLKSALLPTPSELRMALDYVSSDPRDMLDILRKLPQASIHLLGLIGKRQDAFLSLEYEVKPARVNSEDKKELKRCDEITDRLNKTNFNDQLKQIINAVLFGHSVTIPRWELDNHNYYYPRFETIDFVHFAKKQGVLKMMVDRDDKDFLMTVAKDSRIIGDHQKSTAAKMINSSERVLFLDIDSDQLITCQVNPFEGLDKNYIGGWMRPMLYLSLLLHYDVLDWAHFNEMFGMPLRVGKYESFAPDKAIEVLKTAVQNLGSDASAVIDKSTEIEFVESQGGASGGDGFRKFAEYVETKQSVGLRGETLTTEVNSKGGNRALGDVHMLVGLDKLAHDIKVAKPVVTNQIVKKDYQINYGEAPNGMYPSINIYPKGIKDYEMLAGVIRELSSSGLPMSRQKIYDEFKEIIEPPKDKDDTFTGSSNLFNLD